MPPQPPPGLPVPMQPFGDRDKEHLKILSVCYYVMSGLTVIGGCFCLLYMVMGVSMLSTLSGSSRASASEPEGVIMMGGMFVVIGVVGALIAFVVAALEFVVARRLVSNQSRMLCMVIAGINCLSMPVGTVLGVFTFIVLSRPSVAMSFAQNEDQ